MSEKYSPSVLLYSLIAIIITGGIFYSLIPQKRTVETLIFASGANSFGQLANYSTSSNRNEIDLPEKITQIAAGFDHVLALGEDGSVYGWGDNNFGQIGINSAKGIVSGPQKIQGLHSIVAISAGYRHSLALDKNGIVWAWGNNVAGQLGTGDRTDLRQPTPINLPQKVTSITAGHRFSIVTLESGQVYGWGASCQTDSKRSFADMMQLIGRSASGISYYVDSHADPSTSDIQELCEFQQFVAVKSLTPIEIPELFGSKLIVAGFGHILALQADGTVKSKGCNAYGQLGYRTSDIVPAQTVPDIKNIIAIAANTRHSLALDSNGQVWAWGANIKGQLGRNFENAKGVFTPTVVRGLPKIKTIATGHDSSFALDHEGKVWAWGNNNNKQARGLDAMDYNDTPMLTAISNKSHLVSGGAFILTY